MTTLDSLAREVLRHYPRVYVACHNDHRNRKGKGPAVSARDQSILAHVPDAGIRPRVLGQHLHLSPSTVSEALKRLAQMGLVVLKPTQGDARGRIVTLTERGRLVVSSTSVLEIARVRDALARLDPAQRQTVVEGLGLLADAAQAARSETP